MRPRRLSCPALLFLLLLLGAAATGAKREGRQSVDASGMLDVGAAIQQLNQRLINSETTTANQTERITHIEGEVLRQSVAVAKAGADFEVAKTEIEALKRAAVERSALPELSVFHRQSPSAMYPMYPGPCPIWPRPSRSSCCRHHSMIRNLWFGLSGTL